MNLILKTSFIIATILFGVVLSQQTSAPVNGTQAQGSGSQPPPNNGTQGSGSQQPPNNGTQGSGSQQPPNNGTQGSGTGSGVMRSGQGPEGPSNVPPQQPGISDKLAAITDSRLVSLKLILQYLPSVEQDLIAGNYLIPLINIF